MKTLFFWKDTDERLIRGHSTLCHKLPSNCIVNLSSQKMIQHNCFIWVVGDSVPLWASLNKSDRHVKNVLVLCGHPFLGLFLLTSWQNVPDVQNVTLSDPFLRLSPAVWTAATWAMTVTRPTLAASPVSPTARHPSPGAKASPALDSKRATLRLPQGDTRAARPLHSTQPTPCQLAATSAARHASSSWKAWTPMTSSPVT